MWHWGCVMNSRPAFLEQPAAIFLLCLVYGVHMIEEFTLGFVEWANRYFGGFDWTQNLIGNSAYLLLLSAACYLYYRNPSGHLWLGMAGAMWVLANSFIHISASVLGGEYSPGVVTAIVLYIPSGLYFLFLWGRRGLLSWKNLALSFLVGGVLIMLLPTFARATVFHAELARVFHLVQ